MVIDGPTATIIAASTAIILAVVGFVAVVNSRLGRLEAGQQALSEKSDAQHTENLRIHAETRAENLRMHAETRAEFARIHEETRAEFARIHEETRIEFARMHAETRTEFARMHAETRAENVRMHAETKAEIRRVLDALATHSHDADGPVFFRVPPGN